MQRHALSLRLLSHERLGRPAVIVNAHPTKGAGRDNLYPRGGSAFIGHIDQNVTLWNDGGLLNIGYTKIRGAPFDQITVALRDQDVKFSDGSVTQIPVALPLTDDEVSEVRRAHADQDSQVLDMMEAHPHGSLTEWADMLGWTMTDGKPYKSLVNRTLHRLERHNKVKKVDGKWVTTKGRK
jgi:hypothetical protein